MFCWDNVRMNTYIYNFQADKRKRKKEMEGQGQRVQRQGLSGEMTSEQRVKASQVT